MLYVRGTGARGTHALCMRTLVRPLFHVPQGAARQYMTAQPRQVTHLLHASMHACCTQPASCVRSRRALRAAGSGLWRRSSTAYIQFLNAPLTLPLQLVAALNQRLCPAQATRCPAQRLAPSFLVSAARTRLTRPRAPAGLERPWLRRLTVIGSCVLRTRVLRLRVTR